MATIGSNEIFMGKILGELYRMQRHMGMANGATEHRIYGLLNGFEGELEEELENIGFISKVHVDHVANILDPIFQDDEKTEKFKGFYDVENSFTSGGVDRMMAKRILTLFQSNSSYTNLIEKMDSSGSPGECRTFEIGEDSK